MEEEEVHFVCQRCLQPLKLDVGFRSINELNLAELSIPINPTLEVDSFDASSSLDRYVGPYRPLCSSSSNNGFTVVGEAKTTLSQELRKTIELFDLMSGNSEVDHPLCEECTDALIEATDQQLKIAEEETLEYQAYLDTLEDKAADKTILTQLENDLASAMNEEAELKASLIQLKADQTVLESELQVQIDKSNELQIQEQKYWREFSRSKRQLMLQSDEYMSMKCQLRYTRNELDKLKKTNVFNATFHIWHTGHFATINGFRLGRLPSVPVEWSEINAAWGQAALMLSSLAKKIGIDKFQKFNLVPYGSFSYLKTYDGDKTLPLYGSGGFRMIWDTKFDMGMVAFLECLHQFGVEVEKQGSGFALPYDIDKGKIRDSKSGQTFSIKLQFNSEESWTKALRYMLTNLKWGLAFVSTKYMKQEIDLSTP